MKTKSTKIPDYLWKYYKLPIPESEHQFYPGRKWRIDYCYPDVKLAIELEGGLWNIGRHNRPVSMIKDMEKYNALTESGWFLLRYTPQKIDYEQIKRVYYNIKSQSPSA
jgi:very-short-patch-repair endonuclease